MAATIKSHFEEITECSVCACIYADPRTLPCLHTFCLKCIEAWARNRTDAGEKVECPICRNGFLSSGWGRCRATLPKNFAMNNLVELLRDFPDTPASASVEVSRPALSVVFAVLLTVPVGADVRRGGVTLYGMLYRNLRGVRRGAHDGKLSRGRQSAFERLQPSKHRPFERQGLLELL
jgi:hypothetical protein